uniref:Butyrophilin subfamily 1 member A1 n=1 Tax=Pelodiscus sinensis TaxID=13735 RepID=K7FLR2_PELSI
MSAENMEVRWFRTDFSSLVHMYRNGKEETDAQMPEYVGRTDLLRGGLRDGRVALRLRNVQPSDEGRYACYFQSVSFYSEAPLELRVAALGSTPLLSVEGYQDGGIRVVCRSVGWYPEPQVSWRDVAGQQVPPLSETKFQRDGVLFGAETSILVTPLANQNVSCSVGNSRLGQEKGSAVYIAESFFPKESPWIAVLCTLLVVQLGVIGFLIYFFTTKGPQKRRSTLICREEGRRTPTFNERCLDILPHKADVTLDPDTANPYLILSADQKPPTRPKRFVYSPCVLGQEGFTQGRHYWGVDVGRRGGWAVGVARESVSMGQDEVSLKPDAGVWAIERQWWGKSWALTNSKTPLELSRNPQRIRVSLDYEAGLVEFFDADQAKPFCVFSPGSFGGERLFPFF